MSTKLLPKDFPYWRRGSCVPAAFLMLMGMRDGAPVSGWVGPERDEHTWIERDGEIIDPTIRQFRWHRKGVVVTREENGRGQRLEFLAAFIAAYSRPWTDDGCFYRRFSRWLDIAVERTSILLIAELEAA
jgi:hypothetical protein